jgi:alpha-1,3-fucosyltransferase
MCLADNNLLLFVKSKTKKVSWFVSHCDAFSERDKLAEQINSHIDLDIYGKCGKLKCPNEHQKMSDCDAMLNSTYLFYLSFENSLCVDYVTEKIFRIMRNFIIPIVFSGANMTHFLPPKSYIDVDNYESIDDLVKYLNYLASNPHEYIQYFWWKKYYRINLEVNNHAYCDLCSKLNELNSNQKKQFYSDISKWWYESSCTKMKIKF